MKASRRVLVSYASSCLRVAVARSQDSTGLGNERYDIGLVRMILQ